MAGAFLAVPPKAPPQAVPREPRDSPPTGRWIGLGGGSALALAGSVLALAGGALTLAGCAAAPWLEQPASRADLLGLLAALAVAQLAAAGLWMRLAAARTERSRRRRQLHDDLRHLRHWEAEAGVLRKAGMIRDLNALGEVPGDLEGCLLAGADLKGVRLEGCPLRGADLSGADLQGASLEGADLFGADLSGANLTFANLSGANLRGVNLDGVRLNKADLRGANLHRASLVESDLSGAKLTKANLEMARFALDARDPFHKAVHPSVEDWIRERLDGQGRFHANPDGAPGMSSLSDAG